MEPDQARTLLLEQHARLRAGLVQCRELALRYRLGAPVVAELEAVLMQFRFDFAEHNAMEARVLAPIVDESARTTARIERMREEHAGMHAATWRMLGAAIADIATHIEDVVDDLLAHMDAEERTFLDPAAAWLAAKAR